MYRMDPRLAAMFGGPAPTARRIDGMRDARGGKPRMSGDRDYLSGYAAGLAYPRACAAATTRTVTTRGA